MFRKKIGKLLGIMCIMAMVFGGCGQNSSTDALKETLAGQENGQSSTNNGSSTDNVNNVDTENAGVASQGSTAGIENLDIEDMFSNRDKEVGFDEASDTVITLTGNGAACDSKAVQIDGSTVTITDEGTYIVSGSLSDGQLVVDAEDSDKLQIVLNGADITCESSAPIYIKQADKVFITLAANTENNLAVTGEFVTIDDNNIDSAIFSKGDLTINGLGRLKVTTAAGHGIVSKDDLVVTGGTFEIQATGHGLCGKDSVRIADGNFNITVDKDGIHSENEDDTALGFVYIAGGNFAITAEDDGIHAGAQLVIDGGNISIPKCNEGLEGQTVDIRSGSVALTALDDGINAASPDTAEGISAEAQEDEEASADGQAQNFGKFGGMGGDNPFEVDANCYIHISGGVVDVTAYGDGIDSNGALYISGGETFVSGPENGGNGSVDYAGESSITGGVFIAAGSSGMSQNFGNTSTQGSMMVNFSANQAAGSVIVLKSADGTDLLTFSPKTSYNCVIVSCSELTQGNTYTLTAGEESQTIEMTELIYGSGGMGGGMPGGKGGMNGGMGGGRGGMRQDAQKGGQMPEGGLPSGEVPLPIYSVFAEAQ